MARPRDRSRCRSACSRSRTRRSSRPPPSIAMRNTALSGSMPMTQSPPGSPTARSSSISVQRRVASTPIATPTPSAEPPTGECRTARWPAPRPRSSDLRRGRKDDQTQPNPEWRHARRSSAPGPGTNQCSASSRSAPGGRGSPAPARAYGATREDVSSRSTNPSCARMRRWAGTVGLTTMKRACTGLPSTAAKSIG